MKPSPAVSLLLTNLQLLDYSSSNESFPISIETFTSLKNKGKVFEHIIHHLFHTYQPEEAAARFQTCWPVYEPVQARELRNVVFKWLTDLKRSGQLQIGGNVIIRRSLFDDCVGERYEELLLALSTMVLRVQIDRGLFRERFKKTIAYRQCSTHNPSLPLLIPLILAYQSSLTRLLVSRNASKAQWKSFSSFLRQKEIELTALKSDLESAPKVQISKENEDSIISRWRNNWLGDERWLEALINGDSEFGRQRIFEATFDRALAKHHAYGIGSSSTNSLSGIGLLEKQLEEQAKRVKDLQDMRESLLAVAETSFGAGNDVLNSTGIGAYPTAEKNGLKVKFNQHTRIQVAQADSKPLPELGSDSDNALSTLLLQMQTELASVDSTKRRRRPRTNVAALRSYELHQDHHFGHNTEAAGSTQIPRKSNLPQPARIARPPPTVPAMRQPMPTAPKVTPEAKVQKLDKIPEQNVEASKNTLLTEKRATTPPDRNTSFRNQVNSPDLVPERLSPVHEEYPSLSSPIRLRSPAKSVSGEADRPFSASSSISENERFSDFSDDTPYRIVQTPPSSYRKDDSPTPKPGKRSNVNLNESTPTRHDYKKGRLSRPSPRYGRDEESLAEQIVSAVTSSTYSPEKTTPVKRMIPASPRNRFGFRSPEVSPIRESRSFLFDRSDPSMLPTFGTPPSHSLQQTPAAALKRPQQLQPGIKLAPSNSEASSVAFNSSSTRIRSLSLDPVKPSPIKPSADDDKTPKEELLLSDYESVFKSRPKLAFSPQLPPVPTPGSISDRLSPESMRLSGENTSDEDCDATAESGVPFGSPSVMMKGSGIPTRVRENQRN